MKQIARFAILSVVLLGLVALLHAQEPIAPTDTPQTTESTDASASADSSASADQAASDRGAVGTLFDKLKAGGNTVLVQVLISIGGLAFAVERFINLRRGNIVPAGFFERVDSLWSQGRVEEIESVCNAHPSTLARIVKALVAHRNSAASDASTVAGDIGARELKLHLQKAYPIAVVATIEPLLGLFGTVWGMILAFDKVALMGSMGNAAALSSEISLALVTTAVGLAIAIPMLILYHYFKSRTNIMAISLEEQVNELISRHIIRKSQPEAAHAH